jgi:hypothetical protein
VQCSRSFNHDLIDHEKFHSEEDSLNVMNVGKPLMYTPPFFSTRDTTSE